MAEQNQPTVIVTTPDQLQKLISDAVARGVEQAFASMKHSPERPLTSDEATKQLRFKSKSSLFELVRSGQITAIQRGRSYLFSPREIDRYLAEQARSGAPPS